MSGLAQRATLRSLQVCDPTSGDVLADEVWRPLLTALVGEQHGSGEDVVALAVGPLTGCLAQLVAAVERGQRPPGRANLVLLAAYEAAERLGGPLDAVVRLLPPPPRAGQGPLLGVAVAVKDMIDVAGQPRGNGNPADQDGPPRPTDAPVVARLRTAAADVFALSSLLERAAGAPHPDLGEARNPVDPRFTAGGSSGGSAALVGVRACPAALGTDTGGSIRVPAAYCGVVGLKPSYGLLPVEGVEPLSPTCDHVGVLAADVETTRRMMAALTGMALSEVQEPLRFGVLVGQLAHAAVEPAVAQAVRGALALLAGAGHVLVEVDDRPLAELQELLGPIVLHEAWTTHADRFTADPTRYGAPTRRLLETAATVTEAEYAAALARREALLPEAAALLDGLDALVGPTVPWVAPEQTPPFDLPQGDLETAFLGAYNLTGQPALTLPCGQGEHGLPVGLQLAGARGDDDRLLAVAQVVQACLRTGPAALPERS